MTDLIITKRSRSKYVNDARYNAADIDGTNKLPSPGYWELFFTDVAPERERKLRQKFASVLEPNPYFTDMEARLALCLYADMLEAGDWP